MYGGRTKYPNNPDMESAYNDGYRDAITKYSWNHLGFHIGLGIGGTIGVLVGAALVLITESIVRDHAMIPLVMHLV